jgi:PAS domain S-box-containing protein
MTTRSNTLLQKTSFRYLFGIGTPAITFILRAWLAQLTGTGAPFVLFFAAVTAASILAGLGPGACALLLSLVLSFYLLVRTGYPLVQATFLSLLFLIDGIVVLYLTHLMNKSRQAVQEANRRTRELIELAPDAFFLADLDARFVDVNQAACHMLGYSREELVGKTIFEIIPPEDCARLKEVRANLLLPGGVERGEWTLIRKDGTQVPIEVSAKILSDGRWQAFVRDISERKRIEDERQVFVAFLENSSDFIGIADPNGKPLYLNPAGRHMVGLPPDFPVENTQIPEYYPPDQRQFASDVIVRSMVEQGRWSGETYFRHWQTQKSIPVSDEHFMIRDPKTGRLLGMGTITRNISQMRRIAAEREELLAREQLARQQAETANDQLRESEERFRLTIDEAPIGMALIAIDGRVVRVNRALCEILGYSEAELTGLTYQEVTHPDDLQAEEVVARLLARGEISRAQIEKRDFRKDGSIVDVMVSASALRGQDGAPRYYISQIQDITERKRIESEQRFLAEIGPILSSTLDYEDTLRNIARLAVRDLADFCIVDVVEGTGGVRRFKVWSRDPLKAPVSDLFMRYPLDSSNRTLIGKVLEKRQTTFIPILSPEILASFGEDTLHAVRAADARSVIAAPMLAHGKLVGVITFISSSGSRLYQQADVHMAEELAQRAALSIENAQLFAEAHKAVKIREDVLAVVSHDLGNPLTTIELVVHSFRGMEQIDIRLIREFADKVQRSTNEMKRLISDLLDFAGIQSGSFSIAPSAHGLVEVLMPVIDRMRTMAEARQQILEVDLPSDLPRVAVDPHRIGQVLSNLMRNAIKFTGNQGTIQVSARQEHQHIVVSVTDTGPGIPQEHLQKVFDRFWRVPGTKKKGSGLGLSIARGIVEAHGGRIWVESRPGTGCSFFFTLPLANPDSSTRTETAA